jgi:hypothetical protein
LTQLQTFGALKQSSDIARTAWTGGWRKRSASTNCATRPFKLF